MNAGGGTRRADRRSRAVRTCASVAASRGHHRITTRCASGPRDVPGAALPAPSILQHAVDGTAPDSEQEIDQPVYHRAAAVHEIERIQTEPARFAMAAHFRGGLSLDPAAQQCNPARVDPAEALGGQIKSFDERQPVAGTESLRRRELHDTLGVVVTRVVDARAHASAPTIWPIKLAIFPWSIQRAARTRSWSGSIHMMLVPAPTAA